jgi:hypothetical protein
MAEGRITQDAVIEMLYQKRQDDGELGECFCLTDKPATLRKCHLKNQLSLCDVILSR